MTETVLTSTFVIITLCGVVGFFLRDLHTRIKANEKSTTVNHENMIEIRTKVSQIENLQESGFVQMERLFDERFKRFDDKLDHLESMIIRSTKQFEKMVDEIKKK